MQDKTAYVLLVAVSLYWILHAIQAGYDFSPFVPYATLYAVSAYWYLYIIHSWEFVDSPHWAGGVR
jgi:hypothetical protein